MAHHWSMPLFSITFLYLAFALFAHAAPVGQPSTTTTTQVITSSEPTQSKIFYSTTSSSTSVSSSKTSNPKTRTSRRSASRTSAPSSPSTSASESSLYSYTSSYETTRTTRRSKHSSTSTSKAKRPSTSIVESVSISTETPSKPVKLPAEIPENSTDEHNHLTIVASSTMLLDITISHSSATRTSVTSATITESALPQKLGPARPDSPVVSEDESLSSSVVPESENDQQALQSNTEPFQLPGTKIQTSIVGIVIVGSLLGICVVVMVLGTLGRVQYRKKFRSLRIPSMYEMPTSEGWYRINTRER